MSGDWWILVLVVLLLLSYCARCLWLGLPPKGRSSDQFLRRFLKRLRRFLKPDMSLDRPLDDLREGFAHDIEQRAELGQTPDWTRYLEEAERKHDAAAESMRNLATAALATGVGGTMAMLLLHFRSATPESVTDPIADLFSAMTQALWASASGVAANLAILLVLLPLATKRFALQQEHFRESLEKEARRHPPKLPGSTDSGDEPSEAERMHDAVQDLRSSVLAVGNVSKSLHRSAQSLAPSMTELAKVINGLQSSLATQAGTLRKELEAGRSGAKKLRNQLESFPEQLKQTLADSRGDWRKDLEELQGQLRKTIEAHGANVHKIAESLETWRDDFAKGEDQRARHIEDERHAHERFMRDLNNVVTDILAATRDLPGAFAGEVERSADRLGREFGRRAGTHLTDFRELVREQNDALLATWEQHVRRILAEMGHVVHQGLEPTVAGLQDIAKEVRDTVQALASKSQTLNENLTAAARALADSAAYLAAAHETTRDGISNAEATYERINDKILRVAERLERAERSRGARFRKLRRWVRGILPRTWAKARALLRSGDEAANRGDKDSEE